MRQFKFRIPMTRYEGFAYFESLLDISQEEYSTHEYHWDKAEQFTGLYDKHGVEIYSGDIVQLSNEQIGKVVYDDISNANYDVMFNKGEYSVLSLGKAKHTFKCEVIGNVYENEELIKEVLCAK